MSALAATIDIPAYPKCEEEDVVLLDSLIPDLDFQEVRPYQDYASADRGGSFGES